MPKSYCNKGWFFFEKNRLHLRLCTLALETRFWLVLESAASSVRINLTLWSEILHYFHSLHYLHELVWILERILANQDVWTRKRRKRIGKRRRQASSKDSSWQHPRNHEASHPPSGASWWCKKNQWTDLRRNSRCPQSFPRKRDQRCCHLHRARQEEDGYRHGRRLCLETPRTYLVRIRRLRRYPTSQQKAVLTATHL